MNVSESLIDIQAYDLNDVLIIPQIEFQNKQFNDITFNNNNVSSLNLFGIF